MTCPSLDELVLLSMELLEDEQEQNIRQHLETCPTCREQFQATRRGHAELMRTYEVLDRDHDALREQMMASLPAVGPSSVSQGWSTRGWRWLGEVAMQHPTRRRAAGLLAAAAAIAIVFSLFSGGNGGVAFADVIERLQEVKTIVCRLQGGSPGMNGVGKLYLSSEHGGRGEMDMAEGKHYTWFSPIGGPNTVVDWSNKSYMVLILTGDEEAEAMFNPPEGWLARLREMTQEPDKKLGRQVIDGREVEGFEIAGAKLGVYSPGVVARLWVDPETRLPVRFEGAGEPGSEWQATYDQFEFDVPLTPESFQVAIPDDFVMIGPPPVTEGTLIKGLRYFAEFSGGSFPSSMETDRVTTELRANAAKMVEAQGGPKDPSDPEFQRFGAKILNVQTACQFFEQLVHDGREPQYFGDSVEPGDPEAVLLRWKIDDRQSRIIYADLKATTIDSPD